MKKIMCLLTCFLSLHVVAQEKPNVLLIYIDDLNDFVGFLDGHPNVKTPNMDRLAAQGTAFSNAHCQYPLCGPSRASMMSGLYPPSIGFTDKHMKDNEVVQHAKERGTEVLHMYFKKYGYDTYAVGKLFHHHIPEGTIDESGGRLKFNHGTGKLGKNWSSSTTATDWAVGPEREDQTADYRTAKWTVEKLNETHDRPFLLMTGFLRPHVPWYVPQKWFDHYPDMEALKLPPYKKDDLDDIPLIGKGEINFISGMPSTEWAIKNDQWRQIVQAYLACVTYVDYYVGQVLDALEASPYKDNTIVMLISDHGYHMGEKNTFQKHSLWEVASHVPMIVAGPGVKAGQISHKPVGLIDVYPTLVALCGLPKNEKNEGHSLVPLIENPKRKWPYASMTWKSGNNVAVQTERYRYIRYQDGSQELYDHKTDPQEWNNVASTRRNKTILKKMAAFIPDFNNQEQ